MLNAEMNSEFTSAFSTQHSALRASPSRRSYLDVLRGLAVLIMIEAHVLDSWTRFPDRQTRQFAYAMVLGGFGAPLFLFLAGVAVPLSAGSKFRRTGDVDAASRAVVRRGLEVFGLAFLFRIQAWVLGWSAPRSLLKVDILNIMGPSIMAAAAIWGALRHARRAGCSAFAAAMLAVTLLAPIVRNLSILSPLPDPIEAYLRPGRRAQQLRVLSVGGLRLRGAHRRSRPRCGCGRADRSSPANLGFALIGTGIAAGSLRAVVPSHVVSAVAFLDHVAGVLLPPRRNHDRGDRPRVCLGAAARRRERWSPLQQLGRTSLFIYWIHVEMVYGVLSRPLHKRLSWELSWVALALFCLLHAVVLDLKDRVVARWQAQGSGLRAQARIVLECPSFRRLSWSRLKPA